MQTTPHASPEALVMLKISAKLKQGHPNGDTNAGIIG